jgi:hypothetical protein
MIDPNIIDVEASGLGSLSYPIEVGISMANGKKYCSLIQPEPGWVHWDESAEAVHHLTREQLRVHGAPPAEVADTLNTILAGQTVYSDGWGVDKPWVTLLFHAAHKPMDFRISALEMILSEPQIST